MSIKYKKIIFSIGVFILFLWIVNFAFSSAKNFEDNLLRLHVIPNSDSEKDQALKLDIRDKVLEYMKENFYDVSSKDEMVLSVSNNLDNIKMRVQDLVKRSGEKYIVDAKLVNMSFPNTQYGLFTVPSGEYDALRIVIGEGIGENWWCVLFPPLCISNSTDMTGVLNKDNKEEVIEYASLAGFENNVIKQKDCNKDSSEGISFKLKFLDYFR